MYHDRETFDFSQGHVTKNQSKRPNTNNISAAIESPTIVPSYRDKVDPNSRNPSERPRTLSIVKINKVAYSTKDSARVYGFECPVPGKTWCSSGSLCWA